MILTYRYDESTTYTVDVPDALYEAAMQADEDGSASLALAEYIQEQNWEALELIAEWMNRAADRGNEEALAWLQDYYFDDSAYDAYV